MPSLQARHGDPPKAKNQLDAAITPLSLRAKRSNLGAVEATNQMKNILGLLLVIAFCSCVNHGEPDKVLKDFDSVNQSLKEINSKYGQSASSLYDSLRKKLGESHLRQFQYTISDCRLYLEDLKRSFKIFCGDSSGTNLPGSSEDKFSLTNSFFANEQGPGRHLLPELKEVQKVSLDNTGNPLLQEQIKDLTKTPPGRDFMEIYFYDTPPVAVLVILSKFANDINNIEYKILQEQLNK
jgi:hypothetical protein